MKEVALKILKKIEESGYQAYIVGGFVRNFLLGIESNDIDITTDATPKDLYTIFPDAILPTTKYGSVTIIVNQIRFEITTFRKEFNYQKNRRPGEVIYIKTLKEDLLRRDFTVNTLCMDKNGKIIDLLNAKEDLKTKKIKTVQESKKSFEEDALRILRAIRFATTLNFDLDKEVEDAIRQTKYLLNYLSKERIKEELTKIFASTNAKGGIHLLLYFELDKVLYLKKLKDIHFFSQSIGIWAFLEVDNLYPFSKNEKELMMKIRKVKDENFSDYAIYQCGLYASSVAGEMCGLSKKEIIEKYEALPIKRLQELSVNGRDLLKIFNKPPGPYLKQWIKLLEKQVILRNIENQKEALISYCLNNKSMIV